MREIIGGSIHVYRSELQSPFALRMSYCSKIIRSNGIVRLKNFNCTRVPHKRKGRIWLETHAMQTRPKSFKSERQFLALLPTLKILAFLRCIFQRFPNELTGFSFCIFVSLYSLQKDARLIATRECKIPFDVS